MLAFFAAGATPAAELQPALSSEVGYDSNNKGRTSNEDGQARVRTTPEISLRETLGRFAFDANLRVAYDNAIDLGDVDDHFDQFASFGAVWDISSRTQLSLSNGFARVENIDRAIGIDAFVIDEIPDTSGKRTRSVSNRSGLNLSHRLTSRWTVNASADYTLRNFQSDTDSDRHGFAGSASLSYALSARASLTVGGRAAYDSYQATDFERGSRTRYYQGFVGLGYQLAPDLSMSMQVGPAWVDRTSNPGSLDFRTYPFVTSYINPFGIRITPALVGADPSQPFGFVLDQSSCSQLDGFSYASECQVVDPLSPTPVLQTTANNPINADQDRVAGDSNDSSGLNVFGAFSLVKSWEWGDVALAYNRRETSGSNTGDSSTADSVSLSTNGYEPAPLWKMGGFFSWTKRKSSGRVPQDIAAVVPTAIMVDENGLINGPGTLAPLLGVAESNGYVTDGSFKNADDVTSFLVKIQADRKLSEHLDTFGNFSWRRDEDSGDQSSDSDLDDFRVFIGVTYTFDPVLF